MPKTNVEMLDEVQEAISAVMRNQSYTIDGRTLTRANLKDLQEREETLLRRVNREAGGGMRIRLAVPRAS
ncbi:MAG: hypothetical protein ACRC67_33325 [Inquilinus sp.]|uniref:hypothetical protein n=1 Tax=Inquilinus sp. TaxID=1932117 RepID=UPI003F35F0B2